jgi:hypothetical protein
MGKKNNSTHETPSNIHWAEDFQTTFFGGMPGYSTKNFTSEIFNGASIVTDNLSSDDIAQIPGVVNVWPNRKHFLPPLPGPKGFPHFPFPTPSTSNYSVHGLTRVDKVQELGIKGDGVVVGIVDTGIWYPHPAVSVIYT